VQFGVRGDECQPENSGAGDSQLEDAALIHVGRDLPRHAQEDAMRWRYQLATAAARMFRELPDGLG
jgi:hypothetical protein